MNNNEFYIGWMPAAPKGYTRQVTIAIVAVAVLVLALASLLSLQQKKFSNAVFEYGQLTEVTGIYQKFPVPSIKVYSQQNNSSSFITMPLVGYGKHGAEGIVRSLEEERAVSLDQKQITLKGTLIYHDGKSFLQIDEHDKPLLSIATTTTSHQTITKELGTVELIGEVLDPKCYFGVMKPGRGKPHRDCAIRCIAGGISPVFYVRQQNAGPVYYLLLDEKGNKLNDFVKDYVADPVRLTARAVQFDDWNVLYVDTKKGLQRTGGLSWFKENDELIYCKPE
ncbi:hypothetical protein [Lacibacter sp.]|uniref:hypothetical protein n=1 Tax=Lacibacter sp. TaxID=1915409 RepID=UPI002B4AFC1A|nr:hypothetical protein [Lacibacter sp.]HLP37233.1 hypothetical protein [Lacibacter sp.]